MVGKSGAYTNEDGDAKMGVALQPSSSSAPQPTQSSFDDHDNTFLPDYNTSGTSDDVLHTVPGSPSWKDRSPENGEDADENAGSSAAYPHANRLTEDERRQSRNLPEDFRLREALRNDGQYRDDSADSDEKSVDYPSSTSHLPPSGLYLDRTGGADEGKVMEER
jgi:hypothetical protein